MFLVKAMKCYNPLHEIMTFGLRDMQEAIFPLKLSCMCIVSSSSRVPLLGSVCKLIVLSALIKGALGPSSDLFG